jgi:hypothetical protein
LPLPELFDSVGEGHGRDLEELGAHLPPQTSESEDQVSNARTSKELHSDGNQKAQVCLHLFQLVPLLNFALPLVDAQASLLQLVLAEAKQTNS